MEGIKVTGYLKSEEEPHQMRKRIGNCKSSSIGQQAKKWTLSNKFKFMTDKSLKDQGFFNVNRVVYHYADEKGILRQPNLSNFDSTKNTDRFEINDFDWKFAHKSMKRNQKKTILSKTMNNMRTNLSSSSSSSSERDNSIAPLY